MTDRGPLAVTYSEPRPKQTGLDWSKLRPTVDEQQTPPMPDTVADVRRAQMDEHRANLERIERLENKSASREDESAPVIPATDGTKDGDVVAVRPDTGAMWVLPEPTTTLPTEVQAVVETLQQTANSTDMVVAACRAAVIAAADALRGAAIRATEAPRKGDPASRPRLPHQTGRARIEEQRPEVLEDIRHRYIELGQGVEYIGAQIGLSPNTVSRILHRNNIEVRRGGGANEPSRQRVNRRLAELGVTSMQVRRWARDFGLDVTERGALPEHILDRFEESL